MIAPGRQRNPERSRERILAAALDEFSERGFAGARVDAIARRAGLNKQLISHYFGGGRRLRGGPAGPADRPGRDGRGPERCPPRWPGSTRRSGETRRGCGSSSGRRSTPSTTCLTASSSTSGAGATPTGWPGWRPSRAPGGCRRTSSPSSCCCPSSGRPRTRCCSRRCAGSSLARPPTPSLRPPLRTAPDRPGGGPGRTVGSVRRRATGLLGVLVLLAACSSKGPAADPATTAAVASSTATTRPPATTAVAPTTTPTTVATTTIPPTTAPPTTPASTGPPTTTPPIVQQQVIGKRVGGGDPPSSGHARRHRVLVIGASTATRTPAWPSSTPS